MNKPAMTAMRKQAQGGFTLIELIVVIVILGILAATALPRFSNLSGDARVASLNAARGALNSTSAMMHGQFLINPAGPFNTEGGAINSVNGYPAADAATAAAAGMPAGGPDYRVIAGAQNGNASTPATVAGQLLIQPTSVTTTAAGLTCFLLYTEAAVAANVVTPPTIVVTSTNGCN